MSEGFRYTDEQWAEIARELPVRPGSLGFQFVRPSMESAITAARRGELRDFEVENQSRADQCRAIADAARQLITAIASANDNLGTSDDIYPPDDEEIRIQQLRGPYVQPEIRVRKEKWFAAYLTEVARRADDLGSWYGPIFSGPKRNALINKLADRFIDAWTGAGGQLRTSVKNRDSGSSAAGPLIRFLIAGTKPAGVGELTEDAARECVRSHKRWKTSLD